MTHVEQEFRKIVWLGDGEDLRRFMREHPDEVAGIFNHTTDEVREAVARWNDEELVDRCKRSLKEMRLRPAIDRCAALVQAGSDLGAACIRSEYGVGVPRRMLERLARDAGRSAILSFIDGETEIDVEAWRIADLLRNPRTHLAFVTLRDGALFVQWTTGRVRFVGTESESAYLHRGRVWAVDNRCMNKNAEAKKCASIRQRWADKLHIQIPIAPGQP